MMMLWGLLKSLTKVTSIKRSDIMVTDALGLKLLDLLGSFLMRLSLLLQI